ncbi:14498_t:CDS:1 [Dentiscutata erythropus]|uniref:14498_t:CDS:1 n=1 Tax=Dentiscutata erythropus TaxID=1348616 RepID=A0A9N9AGL9_9GLOM|nr:14498_t:CDS:1 [Dentiscutata erythropus]
MSTAKSLLNNHYVFEAIKKAGSCLNEDTEVNCKPTLDFLSHIMSFECKSSQPCSLSKIDSKTIAMSPYKSIGQFLNLEMISFDKRGSSDSSVFRTILNALSMQIEPGEKVSVYTFNLMKRCTFKCNNVQQEVLTWEGDPRNDENKILMYYIEKKDSRNILMPRIPIKLKRRPKCKDQGKCDSSRHRMGELAGSVERAKAQGKAKLCKTYFNSCRAWRPVCMNDCRGCKGFCVGCGSC